VTDRNSSGDFERNFTETRREEREEERVERREKD
jgi:hypothetical protein